MNNQTKQTTANKTKKITTKKKIKHHNYFQFRSGSFVVMPPGRGPLLSLFSSSFSYFFVSLSFSLFGREKKLPFDDSQIFSENFFEVILTGPWILQFNRALGFYHFKSITILFKKLEATIKPQPPNSFLSFVKKKKKKKKKLP